LSVSIKDVARRAGVSIATVSHVLNGTRGTRPQTRQRVLTAIQELGYSQNQAARNLAMGRSTLLGLIISDIRNPFFPDVTAAFQDQALMHNMEALVLNTNYDAQRTLNSVKRLIGLQVPAIAILTSQIDPGVIDMLTEHGVAAVYLDLGRVDKLISNILLDYEHGIAEALEHMTNLGHRQIAYIGGPPHLHSAQRRKKAFLERAGQMGIDSAMTVDADRHIEAAPRAHANGDPLRQRSDCDRRAASRVRRRIARAARFVGGGIRRYSACRVHAAGAEYRGSPSYGNRQNGVSGLVGHDERSDRGRARVPLGYEVGVARIVGASGGYGGA
jgi:DNA-binding LacI/PurR family transcriptional regulator